MEYDPERPEDLASWLGTYVNDYWNQYLRYWEIDANPGLGLLGDAERLMHKRMDGVGRAVRKAVHSLAAREATDAIREFLNGVNLTEELTPADHALLIQALHNSVIVRDSIRIQLGFEVSDELLPQAEQRVAHLVALIASRELSDRAASYLDRATRLYLWGFDPECLVMCRSALEAAIASRLEEIIPLDEPPPPLDKLLYLGGVNNVLEGFERAGSRRGWKARRHSMLWKADRIRWSANRVVHDLPVMESEYGDGIEDGHSALKELADVLAHLFR